MLKADIGMGFCDPIDIKNKLPASNTADHYLFAVCVVSKISSVTHRWPGTNGITKTAKDLGKCIIYPMYLLSLTGIYSRGFLWLVSSVLWSKNYIIWTPWQAVFRIVFHERKSSKSPGDFWRYLELCVLWGVRPLYIFIYMNLSL